MFSLKALALGVRQKLPFAWGGRGGKEEKKHHFWLFQFRAEHDAWVPKAWKDEVGKETLGQLHF